jgi:hypothetical protein
MGPTGFAFARRWFIWILCKWLLYSKNIEIQLDGVDELEISIDTNTASSHKINKANSGREFYPPVSMRALLYILVRKGFLQISEGDSG